MARGSFIVIEGIDGSGKDTQLDLLTHRINKTAIPYSREKQPSTGPIGSLLRKHYLSGSIATDEMTIRLLFVADCYDHITNDQGLLNKLNNGINIVCGRYYHSNLAYGALSQPLDKLLELNEWNSNLLIPDLTIYLDIPAETAIDRISSRAHVEIYESLDKLTRVRENYLSMIDKLKDKEKFLILDGTKSALDISSSIWTTVSPMLAY